MQPRRANRAERKWPNATRAATQTTRPKLRRPSRSATRVRHALIGSDPIRLAAVWPRKARRGSRLGGAGRRWPAARSTCRRNGRRRCKSNAAGKLRQTIDFCSRRAERETKRRASKRAAAAPGQNYADGARETTTRNSPLTSRRWRRRPSAGWSPRSPTLAQTSPICCRLLCGEFARSSFQLPLCATVSTRQMSCGALTSWAPLGAPLNVWLRRMSRRRRWPPFNLARLCANSVLIVQKSRRHFGSGKKTFTPLSLCAAKVVPWPPQPPGGASKAAYLLRANKLETDSAEEFTCKATFC